MNESSDKKTELDEYGVWIKNSAPADDGVDTENINDLPDELNDLSFLDKAAQSTMEQETEAAGSADTNSTSGEEEISLDAFMDGDFTDPNEDLSPAPQAAEESQPPAANDSGEVSLDDFLDGGFETEAEEEKAAETTENEEALDIDLSFDDTPDEEKFADIPQEEASEEFANDDFDALFGDDNKSQSSDQGESVDLSEFGFGDDSPSEEKKSDSGESVDLSEFGFNDDDAGTQADKIEEKKEEGPVDFEMNVETDSDSETPAIAETASDEEDEITVDTVIESDTPSATKEDAPMSAPDDDFDVDSLLDGVDFGEESPALTESPAAEENPVIEETPVTESSLPSDDDSEMAVFQDESDVSGSDDSFNTDSFENPVITEENTETEENPFADTDISDRGENLTAESEETFDLDEPVFEENQFAAEETQDDFNFEDLVVDETPVAESTLADESPVLEETGAIEDTPSFDETSVEEEAVSDDVSEADVSGLDVASIEVPEEDASTDIPVENEDSKEDSFDISDIDTSFLDEPAVQDDSSENTLTEEPVLEDNSFAEESPAVEDTIADTVTDIPEEESSLSEESFAEEPVLEENPVTEETADSAESSDDGSYSFQEPSLTDAAEDIFTSEGFEESKDTSTETEEVNVDVSSNEEDDIDSTLNAQAEESFPALSFESAAVTESEKTIPDTFEEEAASLESQDKEVEEQMSEVSIPDDENDENDENDEKKVYSVFIKEQFITEDNEVQDTVTPAPAAEAKAPSPVKENASSDFDANSLLKDIASQIASLKSEISSLKTEFEELKNAEPAAVSHTAEESLSDVDIPLPGDSKEDNSGFFSDNDEDDTIALSGEELNNILNTAELTPPEEAVTDNESQDDTENEENLSMNFDNEKLEEPVFDESQDDTQADSESQEEISVPKVDDLIVEASSSDLIEEEDESAAPAVQEDDLSDLVTVDQPGLGEVDAPEEETEDDDLSPSIESLSKPIELFKEEEDEELEKGISEDPVNQVFDQWDSRSDDSDSDDSNEETQAVEVEEADVENKNDASSANDIPEGMKEEIKSVLSYMDQLLESLPEEKITEFAQSEQFETYKKLFKELGLA
ncbi:hypothetical protein [Treponema sp.]|uniref:hypothetical protein n=1 Tax=Treponema sp. TaxID=166 RepID=UPI0025DC182C|nr:hypothetical protein [Treponema sp.]MCR5218099.1 hypothetical protein [Treponema sp.]